MSENSIQCTQCGTRYRIPEGIRRSSVTCKKCGATIELSAPERSAGARPAAPPEGRQHAPSAGGHGTHAHGTHGTHHHRHHAPAGPSPKSLAVYALFGVLALAGIASLFFILPGTRAPEFRHTADAAPKKPSHPAAPAAAPVFPTSTPTYAQPSTPAQAAIATPADAGAAPAAGADDEKVVHAPQKLEHLADTSAELRTRIDDALVKILDISNPRPGTQASQELIQIGKPAIPRVLSAMVDLDLSDDKDIIRGNLLDQLLRQVTNMGSKYRPQGGTSDDIRRRELARAGWFQWWGDMGADF